MRFSKAWAETAKQNSILKYCLLFSSIFSAVLAFATMNLAFRPPLIIERACYSNTLVAASTEHTSKEVEAFLNESLKKRFTLDGPIEPGWISPAEEVARNQEQREYQQKKIKQTALVNSVEVKNNEATVEIDRILSVDRLRSVLPATVLVQISSVSRTTTNPYGLIIEKIELKKEGKSETNNN